MVIKDNKQRYCLFTAEAGPVVLTLTVSKALLAGGDFKVYGADRTQVIEQFKLSASGDAEASYTISIGPDRMNKAHLVWCIMHCVKHPSMTEGSIRLHFEQLNGKCTITDKCEWEVENVPPCAVNNPNSLCGSISFILKTKAPF